MFKISKKQSENLSEWHWYDMGVRPLQNKETHAMFWVARVAGASALGVALGMVLTVPYLPQFKSFASPFLSVYFTSPIECQTMTGNIVVSGGTNDITVNKMEFYLDDATLLQTKTAAPYEFIWDSTTISDGKHRLNIKAYASTGTLQAYRSLVVRNTDDLTAPTIALNQPINNAEVSKSFNIDTTIQDDRSIHLYEIYADSNIPIYRKSYSSCDQYQQYGTSQNFSYRVNSYDLPNGQHTLQIKAYDGIDIYPSGENPGAVVYDPTKADQKAVWVANYGGGWMTGRKGSIQKFDTLTGYLMKEVPLTYNPSGLAYDSTQKAIWVADSSTDIIQKFDAGNGNLIGTYSGGGGTSSGGTNLVYDSVNNAIWTQNYITSTNSWQLNKINAITGAITASYPITKGSVLAPNLTEYDSTQNAVWVLNGGLLQRYGATTGSKIGSDITGLQTPWGIEYDSTQNAIWIIERSGSTSSPLKKFNAATGAKVGDYNFGENTQDTVLFNPKDNTILVSGGGKIIKFNAATGQKIGTLVPEHNVGISHMVNDPDMNMIWFSTNGPNPSENIPGDFVSRVHMIGNVNITTTPLTVMVNNIYPVISINAPTMGSTVFGNQVMLSADAKDDTGIQQVDFYVSAYPPNTILGTDIEAPYEVIWDSTMVSNGTYALTAKVTDNEGNVVTSDPVSVTVLNEVRIPPTAVMSFPENNANVNGTITVSAVASDDSAIAKVEFYKDADTTPFASSLTPISANTYSIELDTTTMAEGTHQFYAVAYDDLGLTASANVIYVNIDNTPPTAPTVTDDGVYLTSNTQLHALWTNSADSISGISEYQYMIRQDSITGTIVANWTSIGQATSFTQTGLSLQNGKNYFIGVKAKNGAGLWSAENYSDGIKVDTTASSTPGRPTENPNHISTSTPSDGDYDTDGCYRVYWTAAADIESGIASYQIQERVGTTGSWFTLEANYAAGLNYLVCGRSHNTKYFYQVRAKNNAGLLSNWSFTSDGILIDKTAPTSVTVTDDGATTVNRTSFHAKWTASSDPETGIGNYYYYLRRGSITGTVIKSGNVSNTTLETTLTNLSLTAGTTYYFTVIPKNKAGTFSVAASSDGIIVQ